MLRPARREASTYGGGVRLTNGSATAVRRRSDTLDDSDDYNSLDMTARGRVPPLAPPLSPSLMLGNDYNSPIIRPFPRYLDSTSWSIIPATMQPAFAGTFEENTVQNYLNRYLSVKI